MSRSGLEEPTRRRVELPQSRALPNRLQRHRPRATRRHALLTFIATLSIVSLSHATPGANQGATAESQTESEAAAHADRGLQLAQSGDLTSAESELKRAVELAPNDASFLASLGTVLAMEKKLEESSAVFKRALKLAPDDVTVRRYLAANLWQLNRYPEARQNLEMILKRKPGDPPTLLLLGMVSENMHDYASAAQALSAVPALVRERPESVAALARSYYRIGKPAKARSTLEELLTHPMGTPAILLGAHIADEGKDYDEAEKLLASVKPDSTDQAALGLEIARAQYRAKRFQDSQRTLLDLIAANHATGPVYNLLGWCYHEQNQPREAREALESAIKLEPGVEQHYLDLGNILLAHDLLPAALNVAKRATTTFPNSPQAFTTRGSVELRMSQYSDAVASYSRAAELDSSSADAKLGLVEAQLGAGMTDKAKDSFESGMRQFPKDARFPLEYALMLLKEAETGDPGLEAHGEQLLKSAWSLDHASPEANYQLGELALKQGHSTEALAHLESAVKLAPKDTRIHFALAQAYRRLGRKDEASKEMNLYQELKREQEPTSPSAAGVPQRAQPHD